MRVSVLKDQNSANRRVKSNLNPKRTVGKVLKKSSNPDFASVGEDIGTDLESFSDNAFDESAENTVLSPSSTLTDKGLNSESEIPGADSFGMIGSIEADMLLTSLTEARVQLLKSKDLDHSKSLMDALLCGTIEEFSDVKYEEMGQLKKFLLSKGNLFFMAFMLCRLALAAWNLFLSLGTNGLSSGPPPT